MFDFFDCVEPGFEAVVAHMRIGENCAYAIFAEAHGLDAQLAQHGENGRGDIAIAFQLDYGGVGKREVAPGGYVVKTQVGVDCEPLGHATVDERYAVEAIFYLLYKFAGGVIQVLVKKIVASAETLLVAGVKSDVVRRICEVETYACVCAYGCLLSLFQEN